MLSREEVIKIARLARLELTDAEIAETQKRLTRVLDYMKELSALSTPGDAFVKHVPADAVAFREDVAKPFAHAERLLANAPESEENQFSLPAVLDH
jgi:aspartyl-tRNA(Asn)/glutamyl-tRNA(Gln) amidotransferase subunit C